MKRAVMVTFFSLMLLAGLAYGETGVARPAEFLYWIFIDIGATDASGHCTWTNSSGGCFEYLGLVPDVFPDGYDLSITAEGTGTCPDGVPNYGLHLVTYLIYPTPGGSYATSREETECTSGHAFGITRDDYGVLTALIGLGNFKDAVAETNLSSLPVAQPCTLFFRIEKIGTPSFVERKVPITSDLNSDVYWFINLPSWLAVEEKESAKIPKTYFLDQNYPNPFNASTLIKYGLPEPADVKIEVTNVLGQTVRVLVNEHQNAGTRQVVWDGKDSNGKEVASGVYFYSIKTDKFEQKKRMILLK